MIFNDADKQAQLDEVRAAFPIVDEAIATLQKKSAKRAGRPKKYDEKTAQKILALRKQGISIRDISSLLKMSTTTIQTIIKGYR